MMSSIVTNWVSGNLVVKIRKSAVFDGAEYTLKTVQSFEPSYDPRVDQIDSVSAHRMGYLDRPGIITINLGIIATSDTGDNNQSDWLVLTQLANAVVQANSSVIQSNATYPLFDIEVHDNANFSGTMVFTDCIVASSNPSNVTIDDVPQSVWTIHALDYDYQKGTTNIGIPGVYNGRAAPATGGTNPPADSGFDTGE